MNIQQHINAAAEQSLAAFNARLAQNAEAAVEAARQAKAHAEHAFRILSVAYSEQEKASKEWHELRAQAIAAWEESEIAAHHAAWAVDGERVKKLVWQVA